MPRSARDDDQPGLWPLLEAAEEPTAESPNCQQIASAASDRRNAKQQADRAPAAELEALWRIDDLAAHLGIPKSTSYGWRTTGYGPPVIKAGKHIRWRPASVVDWAAKQERQSR